MAVAPPDRLAAQVRALLEERARAGQTITYREMAKILGLRPPLTIHRITTLLEDMMADDVAAAQPLLSAACVSQVLQGVPRLGFFLKAKELGLFAGSPESQAARNFHARELARLFASYAPAPQ